MKLWPFQNVRLAKDIHNIIIIITALYCDFVIKLNISHISILNKFAFIS